MRRAQILAGVNGTLHLEIKASWKGGSERRSLDTHRHREGLPGQQHGKACIGLCDGAVQAPLTWVSAEQEQHQAHERQFLHHWSHGYCHVLLPDGWALLSGIQLCWTLLDWAQLTQLGWA